MKIIKEGKQRKLIIFLRKVDERNYMETLMMNLMKLEIFKKMTRSKIHIINKPIDKAKEKQIKY